jgi:hypothetical protein
MSTIKVEEGKFYRTQMGDKVGPMKRTGDGSWNAQWTADSGITRWGDDGVHCTPTCPENLVAEWIESPVREVVSKHIVSGAYGRLWVARQGGTEPRILIDLVNTQGKRQDGAVSHGWGLDDIRSAIATLTAIADALDTEPPDGA